jgi:spermidine synthase
VIISDTTDPIGMAEKLLSEEFYKRMAGALKPGGVIVTQCEQMFFDAELIKTIFDFSKHLCKNPAYYHSLIPIYPGGSIGYMYISDVPWTDGLDKPYPCPMNYLNPDVHRAAFALPEFFRRVLHEGKITYPAGTI